ncbi:MAG: 2-succinyl-6-hydroxy-2,4-cyclohexadiene-1-carboxylate synthase [Verrucomicrobiales bacterium]|jgi:2-succinyl-6-hydroxy-2,4-cyclohexadiene-1-carboxylate synthase
MSDGFSEEAGRPGYVALHGMLGDASDWDFMPEFAGVDLWKWNCCLDDIALGADVVLGYSMGGRLALHALNQVKAAVIVSAHTGLPDRRETRLAQDQGWARKARSMPWADFLAEWHAQPVFVRGEFEPDRSGLEAQREAIALAFDRWSLGRQEDLLPRLAGVKIPVLWVNGARDEKFTRIGKAACEVLQQGEHVIIENCGHRVPWEVPEQFSELVLRFLSRHSLCK